MHMALSRQDAFHKSKFTGFCKFCRLLNLLETCSTVIIKLLKNTITRFITGHITKSQQILTFQKQIPKFYQAVNVFIFTLISLMPLC